MSDITRRTFLKFLGATTLSGALPLTGVKANAIESIELISQQEEKSLNVAVVSIHTSHGIFNYNIPYNIIVEDDRVIYKVGGSALLVLTAKVTFTYYKTTAKIPISIFGFEDMSDKEVILHSSDSGELVSKGMELTVILGDDLAIIE